MKLDINKLYWIGKDEVIAENLIGGTGGTVDTVRSDGWWIFKGPVGKMKPIRKLTERQAITIIQNKIKPCPLCGKGFNSRSKIFEYDDGSRYHQHCVNDMNKKEGFNKYMR